jgi:hypothetical protein
VGNTAGNIGENDLPPKYSRLREKVCIWCGTIFSVTPVSGRRIYCSEACRVAMYRHRKAERENEESEQGEGGA